jgi:hypothetical protein
MRRSPDSSLVDWLMAADLTRTFIFVPTTAEKKMDGRATTRPRNHELLRTT